MIQIRMVAMMIRKQMKTIIIITTTTIKIKETMLMGYCHLKLRLIINILIGMYC